MKKFILLVFITTCASQLCGQVNFLTIKVAYSFKNSTLKHKMTIDIGTDVNHPLYQKIENTPSGGIKLKKSVEATDFILISNEVDLLSYFENNGWDLVGVNEVVVIEDKFLHYLFKTETH